MFTGLSSVGAMHLPSKVPSPPRCGRKISNGRKQVADIRQGKRVILTSSSLLKRIVILLIFTILCMLQFFVSQAAFILREVFPLKRFTFPAESTLASVRKKVDPFARTKS